MPRTSRINAMGIWIIACILMVCGALTEYAVILYIVSKKHRISQKINAEKRYCNGKDQDNNSKSIPIAVKAIENKLFDGECSKENKIDVSNDKQRLERNDVKPDITTKKLDDMSLFIFPVIYSILIVVYFTILIK